MRTKNTKEDVDYVPPFDPGDRRGHRTSRSASSRSSCSSRTCEAGTRRPRGRSSTRKRTTRAISRSSSTCTATPTSRTGTVFFLRLGARLAQLLRVQPRGEAGMGSGQGQRRQPPDHPVHGLHRPQGRASTPRWTRVVAWGDTSSRAEASSSRASGWPSLSRVRRLTVGVRNGNVDDPRQHDHGRDMDGRHPSDGGPEGDGLGRESDGRARSSRTSSTSTST